MTTFILLNDVSTPVGDRVSAGREFNDGSPLDVATKSALEASGGIFVSKEVLLALNSSTINDRVLSLLAGPATSLASKVNIDSRIREELWSKQKDWFWDPANGSNLADGSLKSVPVRDFAEIARRVGTVPIQQTTDVWLMGDTTEIISAPMPIFLKDGSGTTSFMFRIRGDLGIQTIFSSVLTGATNFATATNTPTDVTDAAVNWNTVFQGGSALAHRLRRTSDSAVGWINKIISNTQARTTVWLTLDPFAVNPSINPTIANPANADAYVLERLPKIGGVNLQISRPGRFVSTNFTPLVLDSLWYDNTAAFSPSAPGWIVSGTERVFPYSTRCKLGGGTTNMVLGIGPFGYLINSMMHAASNQLVGRGIFLIGGGAIGPTVQPAQLQLVQFSRHWMQQSGTLTLGGSQVTSDGLAIFDSTAAGLNMSAINNYSMLLVGAAALWGSGNATFGADVPLGSRVLVGSTVPTITGATNEVRVAGTAQTWAAAIAAGMSNAKAAGVVQ
jgi:hypothetical protein